MYVLPVARLLAGLPVSTFLCCLLSWFKATARSSEDRSLSAVRSWRIVQSNGKKKAAKLNHGNVPKMTRTRILFS